eukprot:TRINITY_DN9521_c0_g1_i13.p1 TRINITY_DN9521_c0_g1~~TRINITY_DN9521_c0_g1_i13.p1  ORF type:complete len:211 (-),score=29.31 TRINITY_DN9521_c0_g1_i13:21-653(-)
MDRSQKLEYQQGIEKYLENHQVPDLFDYLLKCLLKEKPEDPIAFVISRLEKPERNPRPTLSKTHIHRGPARLPQEGKGFNALRGVQVHYDFGGRSAEEGGEQEDGVREEDKRRQVEICLWYALKLLVAPDDVVIELIKAYFTDSEYKEENYIVEGYPRTRIQAIELQRMNVVPDKFFILTASEAVMELSLIHICRCRRIERCRSRWSPYH